MELASFALVTRNLSMHAWWHTKGSNKRKPWCVIEGSLIFTDVSHTTEDTPLRRAAFALQ